MDCDAQGISHVDLTAWMPVSYFLYALHVVLRKGLASMNMDKTCFIVHIAMCSIFFASLRLSISLAPFFLIRVRLS